jgi:hypothetical protein
MDYDGGPKQFANPLAVQAEPDEIEGNEQTVDQHAVERPAARPAWDAQGNQRDARHASRQVCAKQ